MRHDIAMQGFRFGLRPVERNDAGFILSLRTDPELSAYLHPTPPALQAQEAWLDAYFDRAGDYYFVIEDLQQGGSVGTIGVYDIQGGGGEWGRWLVRRDSLAAVESALLVYRASFENLGLEEVCCRTVSGNAKVLSFHDSSGAERRSVLKGHFELGGVPRDAVEHRVDRARWATMRPRLEMLARRVAGA